MTTFNPFENTQAINWEDTPFHAPNLDSEHHEHALEQWLVDNEEIIHEEQDDDRDMNTGAFHGVYRTEESIEAEELTNFFADMLKKQQDTDLPF